MITDEMVEVAREAMASYPARDEVRAALEAVAPLLVADVQRELDACNGALANSGAAYALVLADRDKLIVQGLQGLTRLADRNKLIAQGIAEERPKLLARGLREAIEVIDASEGDMDFAKFKLESRIQEIDPK